MKGIPRYTIGEGTWLGNVVSEVVRMGSARCHSVVWGNCRICFGRRCLSQSRFWPSLLWPSLLWPVGVLAVAIKAVAILAVHHFVDTIFDHIFLSPTNPPPPPRPHVFIKFIIHTAAMFSLPFIAYFVTRDVVEHYHIHYCLLDKPLKNIIDQLEKEIIQKKPMYLKKLA